MVFVFEIIEGFEPGCEDLPSYIYMPALVKFQAFLRNEEAFQPEFQIVPFYDLSMPVPDKPFLLAQTCECPDLKERPLHEPGFIHETRRLPQFPQDDILVPILLQALNESDSLVIFGSESQEAFEFSFETAS